MSCNCNNNIVRIFKNDDTGAFRTGDAPFLRINRPHGLADDVDIYKLELRISLLPLMTFGDGTEPVQFPIDINLTADQTKKLEYQNNCYIKVYDVNGLGVTCNGTISFLANAEVV